MRTATELWQRVTMRGTFFGARGCSGDCSCDPCECDPCTCGTDERHPNQPRWRVSGCQVQRGRLYGTDVSDLVLLSLSLPLAEAESSESASAHWREVILVDQRASDEQLTRLLAAFEPELISMPIAYRSTERPRPAVFRAPISYTSMYDKRSILTVDCSPETLTLARAGEQTSEPFTWYYNGAMAEQRHL